MERNAIYFDFDCTLTSINVYYYLYQKETYLENKDWLKEHLKYLENNISNNQDKYLVFGGEQRIKELKEFFDFLKNNNYDIYISSRAFIEDIIYYLKLVNLNSYIVEYNAVSKQPGLEYAISKQTNMPLNIIINSNDENKLCYIMPKNHYIRNNIIKHKYKNVIYVDDTDDEYRDFMKESQDILKTTKFYFFGEKDGLVKNKTGLNTNLINKLKNIILQNNLKGGYFFYKYIKYKKKYNNKKLLF
jgi:hypothetical protein